MYLARSQGEAVVLALLSMVCWGSWSNTVVFCGDRLRFELYYLDYAIGILATSVLAGVTLGVISITGCSDCAARFIPDDMEAGGDKFALGIAAGAVFNLANIMLTKGIQMVGLAVAFPLCIGTALVFGTLLTHFLEESHGVNEVLLFVGVAIAFVAVCTISAVHRLKDAELSRAEAGEGSTEAGMAAAPCVDGVPRIELKPAPAGEEPAGSARACHARSPAAARSPLAIGQSPSARSRSPAARSAASSAARSPFSAVRRATREEKSPMAGYPDVAATAPAAAEAGVAAVAYSDKGNPGEEPGEAALEPSALRKLAICITGGILMSFWSPLNAMAQDGFGEDGGHGLSPYGAFFFFCVGTFLSTLVLIPLVLARPLEGGSGVQLSPVMREYRFAPCVAHTYGLVGGLVWAIGTLSNSVSGQQLSFATSYAIGQSAPMVSILWGVFLFREFKGTSLKIKLLLVLVCALYVISISLISASHS